MVKEIKSTIESRVLLSDDEKYRYLLTRVWDKNKRKATVVMLNPSTADALITDRTIMNVTNYLINNNYGAVSIVNLFAYRATKPEDLRNKDDEQESINNKYLVASFKDADTIIVAWVRDEKKYIKKKREVEGILADYPNKTKCFKDNNGKELRHPRDMNPSWELTNYKFMYTQV